MLDETTLALLTCSLLTRFTYRCCHDAPTKRLSAMPYSCLAERHDLPGVRWPVGARHDGYT